MAAIRWKNIRLWLRAEGSAAGHCKLHPVAEDRAARGGAVGVARWSAAGHGELSPAEDEEQGPTLKAVAMASTVRVSRTPPGALAAGIGWAAVGPCIEACSRSVCLSTSSPSAPVNWDTIGAGETQREEGTLWAHLNCERKADPLRHIFIPKRKNACH